HWLSKSRSLWWASSIYWFYPAFFFIDAGFSPLGQSLDQSTRGVGHCHWAKIVCAGGGRRRHSYHEQTVLPPTNHLNHCHYYRCFIVVIARHWHAVYCPTGRGSGGHVITKKHPTPNQSAAHHTVALFRVIYGATDNNAAIKPHRQCRCFC